MTEKFLLTKITELPTNSKDLMKRAAGNWPIKKETVFNANYMIVSYKTEIVSVYKINDVKDSNETWAHGTRLWFDIEETDQYQDLINRKLVTRASFPATIVLESDLVFK
ncbi:hypothetical protein [Vagococcus lutrae]|uniref:hypothetical protein n=1 Tax=Vagococcus lutrae TaxID=81947 RepID=UPI00288C9156|nr:hypothetical protein [Vagococcus lutrae]MDT2841869.1 hypothetical protein [Vagococcus lutrae]